MRAIAIRLMGYGFLAYVGYLGLGKLGVFKRPATSPTEAVVEAPTVNETKWYRCQMSGWRVDDRNVAYELSCSFNQETAVAEAVVTARYVYHDRGQGLRVGLERTQDIDKDRPNIVGPVAQGKPVEARGTIRAPSMGGMASVRLQATLQLRYPPIVVSNTMEAMARGGVQVRDHPEKFRFGLSVPIR